MAERSALLSAIAGGKALKRVATRDGSEVKGAGGVVGPSGAVEKPKPQKADESAPDLVSLKAQLSGMFGAPSPKPTASSPAPSSPAAESAPPPPPPPLPPPPPTSNGVQASAAADAVVGVADGNGGERRRRKSKHKRTSSWGSGLAANGAEQQLRWEQARTGAGPGASGDQQPKSPPDSPARDGEKRVSIAVGAPEDVTDPDPSSPPSDPSAATSLMPPTRADTIIEAQLSAREAREAERRLAIARRQQDALQMLRNIPFVECRVAAAHTVQSKGSFSSPHIAFQIEIGVPKDTYKAASHSVMQRYSRFAGLHEALVKSWGKHAELPPLPPKAFQMSSLSSAQIERRRADLESYLTQLVTVLNWTVEPNIRAFLECDRWLKERRTRPSSAS